MVRLSDLHKARAMPIGHLEAGVSQRQMAQTFGVSESMISKLKVKFRETGDVKDRPRTGRPRKTTAPKDRFITLTALEIADFLPLIYRLGTEDDMEIEFRIRLSVTDFMQHDIRAQKPARKPKITALHRLARVRWCRQHRR